MYVCIILCFTYKLCFFCITPNSMISPSRLIKRQLNTICKTKISTAMCTVPTLRPNFRGRLNQLISSVYFFFNTIVYLANLLHYSYIRSRCKEYGFRFVQIVGREMWFVVKCLDESWLRLTTKTFNHHFCLNKYIAYIWWIAFKKSYICLI